ncbi:C-type lectin galactose-binding isoform-like [Pituophis catenifer annectens]|uniref:C-type lectin galactose-binding isoform-like n=1 Tax=Pituophis catenifer annectens TaxID=94852 RepID=UPI003991EE69
MGQFLFVSLGLLVVAFSLTGAPKSCLEGWYSRNQRCNKLFEEQKNWNDAEAFCQKQNAGCHLASMQSTTQRDDMADYVAENLKSSQSVWIGLHDPSKKSEWEWINRSRFYYLAWADDQPEPSKNNKFCAKLEKETKYFQWSDSNCEELHPFLCQC